MLFDTGSKVFLAAATNSILTRTLAEMPEPVGVADGRGLRIAFCYAQPEDDNKYPAVGSLLEQETVTALEKSYQRLVVVSTAKLTRKNLTVAFSPAGDPSWPAIFHFTGHGERGQLILATEDGDADPLDTDLLTQVIKGLSPTVAVLNICFAASSTPGESSVAETLVQSATPVVIAMQGKMPDAAAVRFADGFYQALADGRTPARAVQDGRLKVMLHSKARKDLPSWALPVSYVQSDVRPLIKRQAKERRQANVHTYLDRQGKEG
jgi:hypothetical protein